MAKTLTPSKSNRKYLATGNAAALLTVRNLQHIRAEWRGDSMSVAPISGDCNIDKYNVESFTADKENAEPQKRNIAHSAMFPLRDIFGDDVRLSRVYLHVYHNFLSVPHCANEKGTARLRAV